MTSAVHKMQEQDIQQVIQIHLLAFPLFFLSFLGRHFLKELYLAIIQDSSGIAYTYLSQGKLLGFVAGTVNPKGFYKRLLRIRWWRFACAGVGAALRKPSIIPRLVRAFSRSEEEDVHDHCAMLMSIAVSPEAQGMGIGKELVKAFLIEVKNRGLDEVNLTTDRLANDATNSFYQNMGFHMARTYTTPEGREMNEYRIRIHPRSDVLNQ